MKRARKVAPKGIHAVVEQRRKQQEQVFGKEVAKALQEAAADAAKAAKLLPVRRRLKPKPPRLMK